MRLFTAVDLDESLRLAVCLVSRDLGGRLEAAGLGRAIKWVAPTNLHLTVRFIGEVDPARAVKIQETLGRPLLTAAFDLSLGVAGVFPQAGIPRVLWLGARQGVAELAGLHEEIERRLHEIGEPPEARPFSAHLTLARFKDLDRRYSDAVRAAVRDVRLPQGVCRIESITLYESRLAPAGPTYGSLVRSPLAGRADDDGSSRRG